MFIIRSIPFAVGWVLVFALSGCSNFTISQLTNAGSPGIGDPYYSNLGNGGYDVSNYTITLQIDPGNNSASGTAVIEAKATQLLDSFNLDLQDLTVDAVEVDSGPAEFTQQEHELVITPSKHLASGDLFSIRVNYHGSPQPTTNLASPHLFGQVGWFHSTSGAINVWNEPNGAATWFPVNDHPSDKATYRFEISVPKPWVVAASGMLSDVVENGDQTQYVWEMNQPMASYLAAFEIDKYAVETSEGSNGISIRNYYTEDFPSDLKAEINKVPEMIEYFSGLFGPYPFGAYGIVIVESDVPLCNLPIGGATELQSMSLYCPKASAINENFIAHELAHEWFGDSVSLKKWQDLWLKEGLATYAEWLWQTRNEDFQALHQIAINANSRLFMKEVGRPPADDLYDWEQYDGGALTIHALRLTVGEDAFFKILHTYLERYAYSNASTQDFIDLSEEISGQELSAFFDAWLLGTHPPDLPQPPK